MAKYESLKEYLRLNNLGIISKGIYDSIKISSVTNIKINNVTIETLAWKQFNKGILTFTIGLSCKRTTSDDNSGGIYYYNVMLTGNMFELFSDLHVLKVEECTHESLTPETVMSLFGIPEITVDNLEAKADELHDYLCEGITQYEGKRKYWFPVIEIKEKYKKSDNMHMWPAKLDGNCLGQLHLRPATADIFNVEDMSICYNNERIPENSILLNSKYYTNQMASYDDIITATHELVHWCIHRDYMKIREFLEGYYEPLKCSSVPIVFNDNMSLKEKAYWYVEWQANELAIRVAIPKHQVEELIEMYHDFVLKNFGESYLHNNYYYEDMIGNIAVLFNVPIDVMRKRFRQLGYDNAGGAYVCVDGIDYEPFRFSQGTLKENETFIIDHDNYERLLRENEEFAEIINSGRYIYLGYVVCMLSSKYVAATFNSDDVEFVLTDYAREHADECLIKFRYKKIANTGLIYSDHISSYLSKIPEFNKVEIEGFKICGVNKELDEKINDDIEKYVDTINELKSRKCSTFANTLVLHMRKNSIDDSILSHRTTIDLPLIRDYYNGKKIPSEENVMALCIGLKLHPDFCYDMFEKANYFIKADTPKHLAYRFLFKYTSKSIDTCNAILEKLGQKPVPKKNKKRVLNS